ncbi:unnamed protein product [Miscanthus lutarioriparius]|uniref:Uncharacterized protein n=1 Tax=Miscanthus lutarioriparius TaxID=422564 RepID=A0A811SPU1_9POAL|nr:unnamed protein product [Miscanthus lutarioriparius]
MKQQQIDVWSCNYKVWFIGENANYTASEYTWESAKPLELQLSNGENRGASGTGIGYVINPMLKVLDEMYRAQDDLARDIHQHDNRKLEWNDEELKKLY